MLWIYSRYAIVRLDRLEPGSRTRLESPIGRCRTRECARAPRLWSARPRQRAPGSPSRRWAGAPIEHAKSNMRNRTCDIEHATSNIRSNARARPRHAGSWKRAPDAAGQARRAPRGVRYRTYADTNAYYARRTNFPHRTCENSRIVRKLTHNAPYGLAAPY